MNCEHCGEELAAQKDVWPWYHKTGPMANRIYCDLRYSSMATPISASNILEEIRHGR
jgi:hypothetical protein